jgi:hypothetical protein
MATRRRQTRGSLPRYLIVLGVLVAGGLLTYGVVRAAGWLISDAPRAGKPSREGMVRVPKSLVNLSAYDVVRREDIYNRSLGDDSYFWLPKQQVENNPDWITRVDDIVGRVMARDKRAEFLFRTKDFLPEGSRSGIAGGIPAGKQGFFLDAEKVPGLRFLKSGDRFDLLASQPEDSEAAKSEYGLLMGGIKARGGKPIPLNGVRILVQDAEMIALTTTGRMTTQGGLQLAETDSRGRSRTNEKDERVAIAIDPAEAVPLTQVLGDKVDVYMVTRSGQETTDSPEADVLVGRIGMPATAIAVSAYSPIKASDLAEPASGELRQYFFQPGDVRADWIARPEELIGRVVGRDVEPGYIFTNDDFLSPGSLIRDVAAFQPISSQDIVGGATPSMVGRFAAGDLAAGQRITESDLLSDNGLTKDIEAYQSLSRDFLAGGNASPLQGRVVSRDLRAGTEIDETVLFPLGVRPGIAAAIPSDRMALTVDQETVRGISELELGHRCDLLSSTTFDADAALSGIEISAALQNELQSRAVNRVLAQDAIIIQKRDQQFVLAVRPPEVSAITKAIATKASVFCVARASQDVAVQRPGLTAPTTATELVSDPSPLADISITESLIGGQRTATAYRIAP